VVTFRAHGEPARPAGTVDLRSDLGGLDRRPRQLIDQRVLHQPGLSDLVDGRRPTVGSPVVVAQEVPDDAHVPLAARTLNPSSTSIRPSLLDTPDPSLPAAPTARSEMVVP
jgi:hypothetical protein